MIMKKICMALLLAVMATTIKAQVTANVRVGWGYGSVIERTEWKEHGEGRNRGIACIIFQANFPFAKGSSFTFSPSVLSKITQDMGVLVPLQVGMKMPVVNNILFFPKIGTTLGYHNWDFRIGPSLALAFEMGHIVVSLDGYVSLGRENAYNNFNYYPFATTLSLGYKF